MPGHAGPTRSVMTRMTDRVDTQSLFGEKVDWLSDWSFDGQERDDESF